MRDYKIFGLEDGGVDLDIIAGEPLYVEQESMTTDQRAALSAYTGKGTIPGNLDFGVDWAQVWNANPNVVMLSNDAQQQIAVCATAETVDSMLPQGQYTAQVVPVDGSLGIIVSKGA